MNIADRRGFSLVELLVAMSLMSVVMTAAFVVLFSGTKAQGYGTDLAHTQEKATVAMQKLTRDLRLAGHGCSPEDTVFQFAGRQRVSFLRTADKDTLPKLVTYYIRNDPHARGQKVLMRSIGDDSVGKPVCRQIAEFCLDYLDRNGRSLLDNYSDEPAVRRRPYPADINRNGTDDILDIRRVSVKIRTRTKTSRNGGHGTCDLESEVVPRNIRGIVDGER
jgi:prepilin-type N-terminal cleavage/methylation domain-containing protein